MSELKATPGPWSVHADVFYQPVIKAPNGFVVATAKVDFGGCERSSEKDAALDTRKANAHLIAAAPELYEALDKAIARLETIRARLCRLGVSEGTAKAELIDYIRRCEIEADASLSRARGEEVGNG